MLLLGCVDLPEAEGALWDRVSGERHLLLRAGPARNTPLAAAGLCSWRVALLFSSNGYITELYKLFFLIDHTMSNKN